ncbi:hypothetical protein [Actinomycetospora sp. TBRC 11914]|uniref:hypothetical protein n=1 Tax=Actinomycetospora sp. TBRC 11914 TaxID=2729387 RepID=UPI00145CD20B|nr:hypothetical protein [Actinomycetospora sp. TBRC 11914]NMO91569.1 hypothetical protein [Actinomycetospora sp. TBRC 11914]
MAVDESAGPDRLLAALAAVDAAHEHIDRTEADLLRRARAAGLTWREIAHAMGLGSPQAASQRAHRRSGHGLARPAVDVPDVG